MSAIAAAADPAACTFFNSVQNDIFTLYESVTENQGRRTQAEIHGWADGGNAPHDHLTCSETFTCLQGVLNMLNVLVGDERLELQPGASAMVPAGTVHCFENGTDALCRFECLIGPGHRGFEQTIQIGYGLACAGLSDTKSRPRNLRALACLVALSDMRGPGLLALLERPLLWPARQPKPQRLGRKLQARYGRL